MLVDSTINVASLPKLCKHNRKVLKLYAQGTRDYWRVLYTLKFLKCFDIDVLYDKECDMYTIDQTAFFKLTDLLCLLTMAVEEMKYEYVVYFARNDIKPFRTLLAATQRATIQMASLLESAGITENNAYIDNFNNQLCFTKTAIIFLLRMISYFRESYEWAIERGALYEHYRSRYRDS